ncbi:MAG: hypothetical protein JXB18_04500 [Sedimentisphaerales bacterium]|nr:hypothetical protein [Sedimentisphaerales bacterium]
MKENKNELKALIEQFMDSQEAARMAEEIQETQEMLAAMPAPRLSDQSLDALKQRVSRRLAVPVRTVRPAATIRFYLSAAAVLLLATVGWVMFSSQKPAVPTDLIASTAHIWEDSATSDNDPVNTLMTKIEAVAGQVESIQGKTLKWFEDDSNLSTEIESLEVIASSTDFWKG